MRCFLEWLESFAQDPLQRQIERYIDRLHRNGVSEEEAKTLTIKAFADQILSLGPPRQKTAMDIELNHEPPDNRKRTMNFIKNYLRLTYRSETFY